MRRPADEHADGQSERATELRRYGCPIAMTRRSDACEMRAKPGCLAQGGT